MHDATEIVLRGQPAAPFGFKIGVLVDPRIERCKKHHLSDILTIALGGVLSGAEGWIAVEQWGLGHQRWLETFLQLPNGIPSHDTFNRVFSRLDPEQLAECLSRWQETLSQELSGVIAIDGKRLRRCFGKAGKQSALHLLTAWASDARVVLAQEAVDGKENEITGIPRLLRKIDVTGAIVTFDAMGCQKAIADQIVAQQADVVMGLKGNQPTLLAYAQRHFEQAQTRDFQTRSGTPLVHDTHRHVDGGHGRIETRSVMAIQPGPHFHTTHPGWQTIQSLIQIHRVRESPDQTTEETSYYISSLQPNDAKLIGAAIRAHWSIENDLHWTLDVQMNEDQCRLHKDHGPQNFALLRRHALSLLKNNTSVKAGVRTKQLRAAADPNYLLKLLNF